ncbi:MAG: hypothetical protein P4L41_02745 [Flavipsychrobacter sp.]|nr:hypothetical protein [Flavipsychrobacter sp.]
MEEQKNYIDNLFREGLGDYTESPPPAAWDALEKRLAQPVRKRLPYQWLLLAFVSSAIVMGILVTKKPSGGTNTSETVANADVSSTTHNATSAATNNVDATTAPATGTPSHGSNVVNPQASTTPTATEDVAQKESNVVAVNNNRSSNKAHVIKVMGDNNGIKESGIGNGPYNNNAVVNNAVVAVDKKAKNTATKAVGVNKAAVAGNVKTKTAMASFAQGSHAIVKSTSSAQSIVPAANADNNSVLTKAGSATKSTGTDAPSVNVVSAAPIAVATKNTNHKHHSKQSATAKTTTVAKNASATKNTNAGDKTTTPGATQPVSNTNNKVAVVSSKQNNIKVVSEVPADVLAAQQQKAEAAKLAVSKPVTAPATTSAAPANATPQNPAPQKLAVNEVRQLRSKNAFTETVSFIKMDAPAASASGNAGGGTADAAKAHTPRWEAGVKAGYESGTKGLIASKYDFAPFLKYNISSKASLILQPGIKFASIKNTAIDPGKNYYKINSSTVDSQTTGVYMGNSTTTYNFTENVDSFKVAHNVARRNFVQFEIPIMFSYQVTKELSLLAGISMIYSKLVSISQDSVGYGNYNLKGSVSYTYPYGTVTQAPGINAAIPHTASPYLTLANPVYQSQGGNVFSVGYMLGFSYNLTKRFMLDGLIQQSLGGFSNIKNADIKSLYTQPYIRLTLGYRLWKQK